MNLSRVKTLIIVLLAAADLALGGLLAARYYDAYRARLDGERAVAAVCAAAGIFVREIPKLTEPLQSRVYSVPGVSSGSGAEFLPGGRFEARPGFDPAELGFRGDTQYIDGSPVFNSGITENAGGGFSGAAVFGAELPDERTDGEGLLESLLRCAASFSGESVEVSRIERGYVTEAPAPGTLTLRAVWRLTMTDGSKVII